MAVESATCPRMKPEIGLCYRGRFASEIEATGIPLHYLGETRTRKPWTIIRARKALNRVICARRIEVLVVHASWPHAMFAPVAKRLGIPVVLWLHAAFTRRTWLQRWAAKTKPDALIFNSEFTRDNSHLPGWAIPSRVIYIPLRHQAVSDDQEYIDRSAIRVELAVNQDDCIISHIARIEKLKGHRLLLSALALLPLECRWVCWIVGAPASANETALLNQLKDYALALGISDRVRFLGERSDIARVLAASDIVVQPNVEPDSFGSSVIEALWHRLPVIATDMGGPKEILSHDYGLLTPPDDPRALAATLENLIRNPDLAAEFRDRGPERARQLCDPATQLDKFCSFFEDVAKARTDARRVGT